MRAAKRKLLRETPLEPDRVAIIARRFPTFACLSEDDQRELLGHVQVFLDEKNFEGCGGLELTDEIKLTIAAQACLLLLHRDTNYYPGLDSILVYPHAYRAPTRVPVGGRLAIETDQARLGESHRRGIVVLSWDAIARKSDESGYRETSVDDGRNVILHEFAHQLDQEDGAADGVPVLAHYTKYGPWARVFQTEFDKLTNETEHGRESDIDAYGATNPAEFFAVVTEAFFETPETLAKNHPRLYAELADYYRQDPLARLGLVFEPPPIAEEKVQEESPSEAPLAVSGDVTLNILHANSAAKLVGVTPRFRDAVVAIGCKPCGYLSSIHKFRQGRGTRLWGFVAEVFACPDPSVVAATYSISVFGDGVAFWTLLDNGTIVNTETAHRATWWIRFLNRISPRDRGEHVFTRTWAESPAKLYARHLDRVRRIAGHGKCDVRGPRSDRDLCRLQAAHGRPPVRSPRARIAAGHPDRFRPLFHRRNGRACVPPVLERRVRTGNGGGVLRGGAFQPADRIVHRQHARSRQAALSRRLVRRGRRACQTRRRSSYRLDRASEERTLSGDSTASNEESSGPA